MTAILYHGRCNDGFGAAWAAWESFGDSARYIAVNDPEELPEGLEGEDVVVLDFSFSRGATLRLEQLANSLEIIDHHQSNQESLGDLPFAHFDLEKSGAMLSWERFHDSLPAPDLIKYVQEYDLWQFTLPHGEQVQAVISSLPFEFEAWSEFAQRLQDNEELNSIVQEGNSILQVQEKQIEEIVKLVRIVEFEGYQVPAVNSAILRNEVATRIMQDYPFSIVWRQAEDGSFRYSLRSKEDFDVKELAERYGGGGHKNSAGFSADRLVF